MTKTAGSGAAVLVVRAWREPEGRLLTRIGAVTDPDVGVARWEPCLGVDQTLAVVRTWLQRWSLDSPVSSDR